MNCVGFDFGTTNSLISICGERLNVAEPVIFYGEDGQPIPSIVCYQGSQTLVGRMAKEHLSMAGLGIHGDVVRSPKILLGREDVFIGGIARDPVDIVYEVVNHVKRLTEEQIQREPISEAVVTIPVNMDGRRRGLLREAFHRAGIKVRQFIHEPLAALYGYLRYEKDISEVLRRLNRRNVLVFDWGGGTLDLTLCRIEDSTLAQIGNAGDEEVGGDFFDKQIREAVIRRTATDEKLISPEAMARLLYVCEKAKISLSELDDFKIFVPGFFPGRADHDLSVSFTRHDLEECTKNLIEAAFDKMHELLKRHNCNRYSVAICLATGGMTNMPLIKARLKECFGPACVKSDFAIRNDSLVSAGAAWVAYDDARLTLAKDVELSLARNAHYPFIKAGMEMPVAGAGFKDGLHLYCVDPRDGHAKFHIQTPNSISKNPSPNDLRKPLASIDIRVDKKAEPFRERLEFDFSVDDNLILKAQARSLEVGDMGEVEIYDLEFSLKIKGDAKSPEPPSSDGHFNEGSAPASEDSTADPGSLTIRANLALKENLSLVPGELMYQINPSYFYTWNNPPDIQVHEYLYYTPCAKCGRASSDPLCKC